MPTLVDLSFDSACALHVIAFETLRVWNLKLCFAWEKALRKVLEVLKMSFLFGAKIMKIDKLRN